MHRTISEKRSLLDPVLPNAGAGTHFNVRLVFQSELLLPNSNLVANIKTPENRRISITLAPLRPIR